MLKVARQFWNKLRRTEASILPKQMTVVIGFESAGRRPAVQELPYILYRIHRMERCCWRSVQSKSVNSRAKFSPVRG